MLGATAPVALAASEPASWPGRPTATSQDAQLYLLAFADQDITQVAGQVLGVILETPFEIDPAVHGTMSLVVEERLTRAQLLQIFEASLARRGVAIVKSGGVVKLIPRPTSALTATPMSKRGTGAHRSDEVVSAARLYGRRDVSTPSTIHAEHEIPVDPWKWSTLILAALGLSVLAAGWAMTAARKAGISMGSIKRPPRADPSSARAAVLDHLCRAGVVQPDALAVAQLSATRSGRPVEHVLNDMGAVSDKHLVAAYAAVTGLPVWSPRNRPPLECPVELGLTNGGLIQRGLVLVHSNARRLTVATSDPLDDESLAGVALETARTVSILICAPADVRRAVTATAN